MTGDGLYVGPAEAPDKYRLIHQVGGGGEATVWKGDHLIDDGHEYVAIKKLLSEQVIDEWKDRWLEQAELLRHIRHPGVVGVHAAFISAAPHHKGDTEPAGRTLYLVMNWVDGDDLHDWQPAGRKEAFRTLTQIAEILDHLHSGRATQSRRPVIHGDLSPANVMINSDGQAVLIDFGLSRMRSHEAAVPMGTSGYLAPEVLAEGRYSPASDRYAFGCLAVYLLTGQPVEEDPTKALAAVIGVPEELVAPIFAADPEERPEAMAWLRSIRRNASTKVGDGGIPTLRLPPAKPPVRVKPGESHWTVLAALVFTAVLLWLFALSPSVLPVILLGTLAMLWFPALLLGPVLLGWLAVADIEHAREMRPFAAARFFAGGLLIGQIAMMPILDSLLRNLFASAAGLSLMVWVKAPHVRKMTGIRPWLLLTGFAAGMPGLPFTKASYDISSFYGQIDRDVDFVIMSLIAVGSAGVLLLIATLYERFPDMTRRIPLRPSDGSIPAAAVFSGGWIATLGLMFAVVGLLLVYAV